MIWRILLLSCCLSIAYPALGQLRHKPVEERHLSLPDRSLQFQIAAKNLRVKVNNHLIYYWVKGADLHHSRGGYEGRVLHGDFVAFYPTRQLKSQGKFHKGLKDGEWKTWYENGELKSVTNWDKGVQHGKYYCFGNDGKPERKSHYKNGQLHGKEITFNPDGTESLVRYKKGVLIESAPAQPEIIDGQVETSAGELESKKDTASFFNRIFRRKSEGSGTEKETPKEKKPKEQRENFFHRIFKKKATKTDDV